jgi:rod shape-determining protein MreD
MKNFLFWVFILFCVALQISLGSNFGPFRVAIPLCLVTLIAYSVFLNNEQLLYMALVTGLILDIASGRYFGLNMFFLLSVVVFCRFGLKLGERSQTLLVVLATTVLFVVLYNFLQFAGMLNIDHIEALASFASQLALQIVYSIVWVVLVYAIARAISTSKLSLKNTRSWVSR